MLKDDQAKCVFKRSRQVFEYEVFAPRLSGAFIAVQDRGARDRSHRSGNRCGDYTYCHMAGPLQY